MDFGSISYSAPLRDLFKYFDLPFSKLRNRYCSMYVLPQSEISFIIVIFAYSKSEIHEILLSNALVLKK